MLVEIWVVVFWLLIRISSLFFSIDLRQFYGLVATSVIKGNILCSQSVVTDFDINLSCRCMIYFQYHYLSN